MKSGEHPRYSLLPHLFMQKRPFVYISVKNILIIITSDSSSSSSSSNGNSNSSNDSRSNNNNNSGRNTI